MQSIRERRIENEWRALLELAERNPAIVRIIGRDVREGIWRFEVELSRSAALVEAGGSLQQIESYSAVIEFPEFFPSVPMQVFLCRRVVHPNVHPLTGFACIWDQRSAGDSVVAALQQLQRVVCWQLFNEDPDHVIQPEAFELYRSKRALPADEIRVPDLLMDMRTARAAMPDFMRRRLSPL